MQIASRYTSRRAPQIVLAIALLAATVAAYAPALRAGYVWDDREYIFENPLLTSVAGLREIWLTPRASPQYYPLSLSALWAEFHVWNTHAAGYHAVNIALHATNALLVWLLLRQLGVAAAYVAALIFALHPMHVETVAWAAEQKGLWAMLFMLLSARAWLRDLQHHTAAAYLLMLLSFACALLSKTAAVILPATLFVMAWRIDPARWWRNGLRLLPCAAMGVAAGALTAWRERLPYDFQGALPTLSVAQHLLIAARALAFYASHLVWPAHLATIYPQWSVPGTAALSDAVIVVSLVCAAAVIAWRRHRLRSLPAVGVLHFVISLVPVLGFVEFGYMRFSFVADHFVYFGSIGLIAIIAAALAWPLAHGRALRWAAVAVVALALAAMATRTWTRCLTYHDEETLWRDNLANNPTAWYANYNLGTLLMDQGRVSEAIPYLSAAARLNPEDGQTQKNLGTALAQQGRLDEAIEHFAEVVRIAPNLADGHSNWGLALAMQGNLNGAIEHYRTALSINPTHAAARVNYGLALEMLGDLNGAIEQYTLAVRFHPERADLQQNLQRALNRHAASSLGADAKAAR